MKKLLLVAALFCATAIIVQAEDAAAPAKKAKKELTAEQKHVLANMVAKYDANKDGKLDKTEKAAMSKEDKEKMTAAGLGMAKKKPATTEAPKTDAGK